MARNRGKRPGGASGSTSRRQNQTEDAQTKADETQSNTDKTGTETSQADGGKGAPAPPHPTTPSGASRAIAAKIEPPASTEKPASAGKTPGQQGRATPAARSPMPTAKATSSPSDAQSQSKARTSSTTTSSAGASPNTASASRTATSSTGASGTGTSSTGTSGGGTNGGGFWTGLIGGVVGGAATALAVPMFLTGGEDAATTALESRLAAAEQQVGELGALDERVAAIESAPEGAAAGDDALTQRLDDLETQLAVLGEAPAGGDQAGGLGEELGARLASLEEQVGAFSFEQQITALEQQVQGLAGDVQSASQTQETSRELLSGLEGAFPTLEAALAATGKTVEETGIKTTEVAESVATLSGDVQTLSTRVGEAEGKLDHIGGEYQRGAAMIVAIGDIDRAITKAGPFDSSLQSLKSLLRDETVLGETLSVLEPVAADGVPSVSDLRGEFGAMASRVLLAEKGDKSVTDQVSDNLFGIINMRPSGAAVEGSDSRAVLARAQAKLSGGNLEDTIAELAGLEGAAAEESSAWVERARARLTAEAAVVDLRTHAQGLVAGGS